MNHGPFFDYARERHLIWMRRAIQQRPRPWTDDPILQQYRFCNVYRELDKVTIWVRKYIREPFADHPNLWFMLAIARQINHPPTLQELMDTGTWPVERWDAAGAADVLDARKARGEQVYTGAYMIRAESDPKKAWYTWTKQRYMAEIVLGQVWNARHEFLSMFWDGAQPTLEEVHGWFMKFHGWGHFMSYEVVTDLRHTRYLDNAADIMTWANPGPGARRGLNRIHDRPLGAQIKTARAVEEMRSLLLAAHNPNNWPEAWGTWEMRDVEHTLCEFDKYERVRKGEGRPRSRYAGV